jgi:hypothetical protein
MPEIGIVQQLTKHTQMLVIFYGFMIRRKAPDNMFWHSSSNSGPNQQLFLLLSISIQACNS